MEKLSVSRCLQIIQCLNEKVTLLGIGPLSRTIVEASIESALENDFPIFFIASRNQIDRKEYGAGYVESWDQAEFSKFVYEVTKKLSYDGLVFICRDHGGPWQRDEENHNKISYEMSMNNCLNSFYSDILAKFDIIHIDTSKDPNYGGQVPHNIAVDRIINILASVEEFRIRNNLPEAVYEVSLEETNGKCSIFEEFSEFVDLLIRKIHYRNLPRPMFVVGNTATLTRMGKNVGKFNPEIVHELKKVTDRYGLILKEHNTDYLSINNLNLHPELGIGMSNVAPEFGNLETEALLNLSRMEKYYSENNNSFQSSNFDYLIFSQICNSGKWKKWLDEESADLDLLNDPKFRDLIININGHYYFSNKEIINARNILYDNIKKMGVYSNPHKYVKEHIKSGIKKYVDAFNLKDLTSKIYNYEKNENMILNV